MRCPACRSPMHHTGLKANGAELELPSVPACEKGCGVYVPWRPEGKQFVRAVDLPVADRAMIAGQTETDTMWGKVRASVHCAIISNEPKPTRQALLMNRLKLLFEGEWLRREATLQDEALYARLKEDEKRHMGDDRERGGPWQSSRRKRRSLSP